VPPKKKKKKKKKKKRRMRRKRKKKIKCLKFFSCILEKYLCLNFTVKYPCIQITYKLERL
jgi:hypothetical protein